MTVEKTDYFIKDGQMGTVTEMNHVLEFQFMERKNQTCPIMKLDANRYMVRSTGEVKECKRSTVRSDNTNSLKQTFKKLGYMINRNFTGAKNELFLTLTFRERVGDVAEASKQYFQFKKRFERHYANLGKLRMLAVKEPQADGTWHYHVLVKFLDQKKVTILNKFDYSKVKKGSSELTWEEIQGCKVNAPLFDLWGQGFVTIRRLKNTDNVGAYLTAYMADLPLEDIKVPYFVNESGDVKIEGLEDEILGWPLREKIGSAGVTGIQVTKSNPKKAVIKGGRLTFYPRGTRLYNCVNCVEPTRREMSYQAFKKRYGVAPKHLTLRRSLKVIDEELDFSNIIVKEQYNKKVDKYSIFQEIEKWEQILADTMEQGIWHKKAEAKLFELRNKHYLEKLERTYIQKNKSA